METESTSMMTGGFSSSRRLLAITLMFIAIVSPLYVDRLSDADPELEDEPFSFMFWLPMLLLLLILAIALSLCCDQSLNRFDPYWIHRVGGSSGGILVILIVLALVLKCKGLCLEPERKKLQSLHLHVKEKQ